MVLVPVQKSSISDAVFEQLRSEIVQGRIAANADLPSERELSQTMQVNRHAVREAVRRLEQAGLVQSQHGTGNKVLDFRQHAGLGLLPDLLVTADGDINTAMVRSVLELRHALAPAVARACAQRGGPARADRIYGLAVELAAEDDLPLLQKYALDFWEEVVQGSDNLAYRLAFNSLRHLYEPTQEVLATVLESELRASWLYQALAEACVQGLPEEAALAAQALARKGLDAVVLAIAAYDAESAAAVVTTAASAKT